MFCQNFVQQVCCVVVRKANFLRQAFFFQFLQESKFVVFFCQIVVLLVKPVQHIYIKIFHTATGQLGVELCPAVVIAFYIVACQL